GLDPEKKALIEDVARRYLAGAKVRDLAKECGMSHIFLYRIFRKMLGSTYDLHFRAPRLGINETVTLQVPPLLDEQTIQAIHRKTKNNQHHTPGKPKYDYLLNHYVYCAGCGYAMSGQPANVDGHIYLYYRHRQECDMQRPCPFDPRPNARQISVK